ncbi:hypothetical protein ACWDWO_04455 [Actinopolymorpha singaporensis]
MTVTGFGRAARARAAAEPGLAEAPAVTEVRGDAEALGDAGDAGDVETFGDVEALCDVGDAGDVERLGAGESSPEQATSPVASSTPTRAAQTRRTEAGLTGLASFGGGTHRIAYPPTKITDRPVPEQGRTGTGAVPRPA